MTAASLAQYAERVRASRVAQSMPCPYCKSARGVRCVGADGNKLPIDEIHTERKELIHVAFDTIRSV